jgi:fumarylacetoacetase
LNAGSSRPVEAYGIGSFDGSTPRALAKSGAKVVDLDAIQSCGALRSLELPDSLFAGGSLNGFMSLGRDAWSAVEERLTELIETGRVPNEALHPLESAQLQLPVEVADFCDFYASEYHASNIGRILRPGADPLPAAWRIIPLGYHGRAGTVVVSGTPVRRPKGVVATEDGPRYGPSRRLDLEVELGYVVGVTSSNGQPVRVQDAHEHIFGVVVVNDWSARDIQAFEYQPLGPFLGKSFATSLSAWVVPLSAIEPWAVDGPGQGDEVPPHLACAQPRAFDVNFELSINSTVLSRPAARYLHWSAGQLVSHLTSNGAGLRTGDILATGTVSGPDESSWGCLMELTWGGERPVSLSDGSRRSWLEDGDTVAIRATCGGGDSVNLGEVTGQVLAQAMIGSTN